MRNGIHKLEYKTWASMKQRCYNPNSNFYHRYGGRGITVCDRWRDSFEAFLDDIGLKPSRKHSIDRIDGEGNYEPGNVRWASPSVQQNNRGDYNAIFRGVYERCNNYRSVIYINGKNVYIGTYPTLEEAISGRLMAESVHNYSDD